MSLCTYDSMYLRFYIPIYSIGLYTYESMYLWIYVPISLYTYESIYLWIYASINVTLESKLNNKDNKIFCWDICKLVYLGSFKSLYKSMVNHVVVSDNHQIDHN